MKKFLVISTLLVAASASVSFGVRTASTPTSPLARGTVLDPFRLQVVTSTSTSAASTPVDGGIVGLPTDGLEETFETVRPGPFTPPPRSPYAPPPR